MNSVQRVSFNTNFIGGTLSIIASVLCNVGIVLQKQSHARNAKDDKTLKYANATWLWGIIFQLLGGIVDFEALTYATQELVALVGGSSTVLIGAVCSFLIEDNVAPRITDLFGILVLLIAVVCAAYGSPAEHSFYTLEDLEQNFFKPHFVRYAISVSLFTFFLLTYAAYNSKQNFSIKDMVACRHRNDGDPRTGVPYATVAGILGSFGVLFAKCVGEVLERAYVGRYQGMYHIQTYMYFIATLGFLAAQLFMINRALMAGDYMTVLPTFQISWILFSFSGGIAFFNDGLSDHEQTFLSMSLLLSILGIYMLSQRRMEFSKYRARSFPFSLTVKRYENGSLRAVSPFSRSRSKKNAYVSHDIYHDMKDDNDDKHSQYGSFLSRISENDILDNNENNGV